MTIACCEMSSEKDLPDLIPARMLNEFTYCPRLAYLEWVQCEWADNLETHEGRFGHRRVDKASTRDVPEPDAKEPGQSDTKQEAAPETIHSRSLLLSAPREGLIAKMDLVDISSAEAIPVDYKRGQVPDVDGGAWEPERVQLCAQGLILRENGYSCEGGILYFIASRRRVAIPFDDELVSRTRELLAQMRAMGTSGTMPPPLDDSPKCPKCSLVGICLPDETALLREGETDEDPRRVRRLLPTRQDALPLYLQEQGAWLGKSGDELTVKQKGTLLTKVRLIDTSQVSLFGNVQVSAQALREITARAIPVCHFTYGGWFHAVTIGMAHKNVELRIRQYATAADPAAALAMARAFVVGKIKNCRTLLRRHLGDDPERLLPSLNEHARKAESARDVATLLGLEGMAAKLYFPGLASLFKSDETFHFENRNRRPPRDSVNALLSFVYGLLVKELTVALYATGFDPMLGFYHRPRYGRPSLALDLAEEFRPLIADSVVLTLINNKEVAPKDFIRRAGGVALTPAGRKAVIASFERRMESFVTHPIFKYRVSYRRILEVQSRLLARVLLKEIDAYPNFCTR